MPTMSRTHRHQRFAAQARRANSVHRACIAAALPASGTRARWAKRSRVANVVEMGTVDKIPEFIQAGQRQVQQDPPDGLRHRVYKNYDPRAN